EPFLRHAGERSPQEKRHEEVLTLEHRHVDVVAIERLEQEPRGRQRAATEEDSVAFEAGWRAIRHAERMHLYTIAAFHEARHVVAVHVAEPGVLLEARQRVRRIPDEIEWAAVQTVAALNAPRVAVRRGGAKRETRGSEA